MIPSTSCKVCNTRTPSIYLTEGLCMTCQCAKIHSLERKVKLLEMVNNTLLNMTAETRRIESMNIQLIDRTLEQLKGKAKYERQENEPKDIDQGGVQSRDQSGT